MKNIFLGLLFISYAASAQDTTRLSLVFFGDIMQHDSQIGGAYDTLAKTYDYSSCFQYIKPYLDSADLAIGNLEVTLAGPPYKGYPLFSAPDELLTTLKDTGVDVLVTANNHCVDRGRIGLERTVMMLDSFKISHTGTFIDTVNRLNDYPLTVLRNGFALSILNYTYGTNGMPVEKPNMVNRIDTAAIKKDLTKAREAHSDAIIVFMHWGSEYQSLPSKFQKELTDFCFQYGAKMVIGSHPHVLQPMEWRKESDQLVAYSLGNFVSGQRKRYTDGGALLKVELQKIIQKDSSSSTQINNSGYLLEWVYRTSGRDKKYFILPSPEFEAVLSEKEETDEATLNLTPSDKQSFKLFLDDSRALFKKHNLNIEESIRD
ncbi:MAG: CapA family protein [Bacteroidia bacterium]|nr:CapA family protein [Bacteroidia bacterium]